MKKTAIILGATGLIGNLILQKLINDDRYDHIKLFSRSKIENLPSKVSQYIGNLLELQSFTDDFTANEVFCCIGTTAKKTPDKNLYHKIDYGIPVNTAQLCKLNNISAILVISAMGANSNSNTFYNRTKGEMEQSVLRQSIKHTHILRPSLIEGDRNEHRVLESIGIKVFKCINPILVGGLKKYRSIKANTIAEAMIYLANNTIEISPIISSETIKKIIQTK